MILGNNLTNQENKHIYSQRGINSERTPNSFHSIKCVNNPKQNRRSDKQYITEPPNCLLPQPSTRTNLILTFLLSPPAKNKPLFATLHRSQSTYHTEQIHSLAHNRETLTEFTVLLPKISGAAYIDLAACAFLLAKNMKTRGKNDLFFFFGTLTSDEDSVSPLLTEDAFRLDL